MFSDKDYRTQKARVQKLLNKWITPLGLRWWKIHLIWDRGDVCKDDGEVEADECCKAHVKVQWEYLRATVTFHLLHLEDEKDDELEWTVVHELCHILVKEMRAPIAPSDEMNDEWAKHEERVVSSLASAFIWTYEEGSKAAKKPTANSLMLKAWQAAYDNHRKKCKKRNHAKCQP